MGQEFHVLRCFSCQSFQVQQVKKVNKWTCKLCGEKQSLLKEFGRGSGADCRRHVQKLNAMRGAMMEAQGCANWSLCNEVEEEEKEQTDNPVSRWNKYMDTPEEAEPKEEEEEELEENALMAKHNLPGNKMIDRKRKRPKEEPDEASRHTPEQFHCATLQRPSASTRSSSAACQVQEHTDACSPRRGQPAGGATSCPDIGPLFTAPSMFESGEDFSFDDDDFLINQKV